MTDLDRILSGVSRSFYLSLRLLPGPMRHVLGTGYLIARATDTIADSTDADPRLAVDGIRGLMRSLETGSRWETPGPILAADPRERDLLGAMDELIATFSRLAAEDRRDLVAVLRDITSGQMEDLTREGPVESDEALDRYTYLVAGSVGAFWTKVGLRKLPRFARRPPEEMLSDGIAFGKGLQLVNILRDLGGDARKGRQYLPELTTPCWRRWKARCIGNLHRGALYSSALCRGRLRLATFLPWHLGIATVSLLPDSLPQPDAKPVKVSRTAVRRSLATGLLAAFSDRWHEVCLHRSFPG